MTVTGPRIFPESLSLSLRHPPRAAPTPRSALISRDIPAATSSSCSSYPPRRSYPPRNSYPPRVSYPPRSSYPPCVSYPPRSSYPPRNRQEARGKRQEAREKRQEARGSTPPRHPRHGIPRLGFREAVLTLMRSAHNPLRRYGLVGREGDRRGGLAHRAFHHTAVVSRGSLMTNGF